MPEPLDFQIYQDLETSLEAITVAAGYFHDLTALTVKLDADHAIEDFVGSTRKRPFIVLEYPPVGPWEYQSSDQVVVNHGFTVHFVNDSDPKDDAAMLKEYRRQCADVEKAITVNNGHTRGGLATDTKIQLQEMHELEGQLVWSLTTGLIREYREYGKPNG